MIFDVEKCLVVHRLMQTLLWPKVSMIQRTKFINFKLDLSSFPHHNLQKHM